MRTERIVKDWFHKWTNGDFMNLPISENFKHTSPYGTIQGKKEYLDLVNENKEKFLGYDFILHDGLYDAQRACVRYTAKQGEFFELNVCEWYYIKENLIEAIVSYYHLGDIPEERKLKDGSAL